MIATTLHAQVLPISQELIDDGLAMTDFFAVIEGRACWVPARPLTRRERAAGAVRRLLGWRLRLVNVTDPAEDDE